MRYFGPKILASNGFAEMKILIVEDEEALSESMVQYLSREGFVCETAYSLDQAVEKIELYLYDAAIVDLTLPDGDGLSVILKLKRIAAATGIIIVSARKALEDKIKGLEMGSDDYLTKPFSLPELNARLKSLIRRRHFGGNNEIIFREIRVKPYSREVFVCNRETHLSRKEYDLLLYFLSNIDAVLTKESIAEHLWGDYVDSADSLDMVYSHIKNLRKKLNEHSEAGYIQSVYGIGYKFRSL